MMAVCWGEENRSRRPTLTPEAEMDGNEFNKNLNLYHTPESLAPYEGRHVAWSVDGKRILAAADSYEELYAEVDRLGIKEMEYVSGFVPRSDVSYY
jgi:hypothetical protein